MKIQLIDKNEKMCEYWETHFKDCDDVIVHCGDFFSLKTDCVVSPANSFGFMDGALDYVISMRLGWQVQRNLQLKIQKEFDGELLVGQATILLTESPEVPYLISAPTMRVPIRLQTDNINVYLASKSIFNLIKKINKENNLNYGKDLIDTVTISGLGTGVGRFPYELCALQMREAYNDVWLNQGTFPVHLGDIKHYELFTK